MMVREPSEYEYSSFPLFVSEEESRPSGRVGSLIAEAVDTSRVLGTFRTNPREQYRMFVEEKISHAEHEMLIMKEMRENEQWLPW